MSSPTANPAQPLSLSTCSPDKTETTQADTIRNTMKVDNLLSPAGDTPEVTAAPPVVAAPLVATPAVTAPSTPAKPIKEEVLSPPIASPDTVMSEPDDVKEPVKEASEETTEEEDDETTAEDLPDSEREFICMNDEHTRCITGQYTKDLSRKVISDHFGRNKSCTRDITDWPLFCRKHYQRATYSKPKWQIRKVQLIFRQLDVIEHQFPGTTYDVALKKSEETRLNQYCRQVNSGIDAAEAEKNFMPSSGKHFEAPIDVLRELDQWLGRNKSYGDVKKIVDVILQMLEDKDCTQVPAIEFLPHVPGKVKTPIKARASTKSSKTPKTPSHVSPKGAVKKTNRKA
ncbi:hypothetical protein CFE70_005987 [Pyrenophora teres f. teres 0-1]|uniref:Uncharacterized protein n=2 Tax=Pyrenophora teres f. teres TaxID=97479 RepID=E3RG43_PYRTT|nr:hypothetical protein PTT_06740 [Pyrenophora teres f. teres 0-1]